MRLSGFHSYNLKSKIGNRKWGGIVAFAVALALCGAAAAAQAQQPGKIYRIGFLDPSTRSGTTVLVDAFREELGKLGWVEGKNLAIEYRFAESRDLGRAGDQRLKELAADLVRLKVDLIVATGSGPLALAAKNATATIPIVLVTGGNVVAAGLVTSLARPGGNVTGLTSFNSELITKRLGVLKEAIPKLARVGLLWTPIGQISQMKTIRPAAQALKIKLEEIQTELDAKSLENAFVTAKQRQVEAIMTTSSQSFSAARKPLVELAGKYRLPAIYFQREFVDDGGLMSYGVDYADLYRRAAVYIDKILKGAKPADLPVEQPTKFEFVINLKAAKQIGLTIPANVLARADRVIK